MSTVKGQFTVIASESDCLNMKDQAAAVASVIDTKATTTHRCFVTVTCAMKSRLLTTDGASRKLTTHKATIDYMITLPSSGTPTPAKAKANVDAVTAATWTADIAKKVGAVTGIMTTPSLTSWTTVTKAIVTTITTPKPPTTSYTGSSTVALKQKLTGKLAVSVATLAECDKLKATDGLGAIKTMLVTESGSAVKATDIFLMLTCSSTRRMSDGRRMVGVTAAVDYEMLVANKALADAAKASLTSVTNDSWKSKLQAALVAKGVTGVTITGVMATAPTMSVVHEVSSALTSYISQLVVLTALVHLVPTW